MKFCEKLTKLRKDNNLSQEALAEKLKMSRQAISKWESGNSYPDMSTMINVCKVLNCTLEDLLDDDALGQNSFTKNDKFNINKWIKDLLDFITKSYNMFWSMKLIEKIKCLIEIIIIIFILYLAFMLIGTLLSKTVLEIFSVLPNDIYYYILKVFKTIYSIFTIILGFIITLHLFKIRYLDYYITIEDTSVDNKTIENDINVEINKKDKNKYIKEKSKEKIIIRDPKHTTYSFFNALANLVLFIVKMFAFLIFILIIISFICLVGLGTISIIWLKYGFIFFGIFIIMLGAILVNYTFIELIYNFIFNRKSNFKRIFITLITGFIIFGIGCGVTTAEFSKFEIVNDNDIMIDTLKLDVKDNMIFTELENSNVIIDNKCNDIKINVKYSKYIKPIISDYGDNEYYITYDFVSHNIIKLVLNDIKDKKLNSYESYFVIDSITLSQKNYDLIINNNKKIFYYGE